MTHFDGNSLKNIVETSLPDSEVIVEDTTGTNDHFQLTVIAETFSGRSPIERHRMIFKIIGDAMGGPIHALSIKTLTPTEAKKH